jgi:hypothetical protein
MFKSFRKSKPRRLEIRRQRSDQSPKRLERLTSTVGLLPVFVVLGFFGLATTIILTGRDVIPYAVGQKIDRTVLSRVDFKEEDVQATNQAREAARDETADVFVLNQPLLDKTKTEFQQMFTTCKAHDTYEKFLEATKDRQWNVKKEAYEYLKQLDEPGTNRYQTSLNSILEGMKGEWLTEQVTPEQRSPASKASVIVLKGAPGKEGASDRQVDLFDLTYHGNAKDVRRLANELVRQHFPLPVHEGLEEILRGLLTQEPIYRYDPGLTQVAMKAAAENAPTKYQTYGKETPLLNLGKAPVADRLITEQALALLALEQSKYLAFLNSDDPAARELRRQRLLQRCGTGALVLLITIGIAGYVLMYQPRIAEKPARGMALAGLLLGMLLAAKVLVLQKDFFGDYREYSLLPVVMAGAILTIAYTHRFSLGIATCLSALVTLAVGGDLGLVLMLVATAAIPIMMLREIRTRGWVIEVGLITAVMAFLVSTSVGFVDGEGTGFVMKHALAAALAAFSAALVIQGILPFVERAFRISTSISLLEYCDANRPLLKRLAQEAPGTYNHSLVLSTVGEAAANAIGANGLLVRVGALYHDIGKINKPDYFAENQESRINRHDKLSPTMSLLIILGHVKDGSEMGKEYGLPPVLLPFIQEHHGTTLVRYFHHAASEQQPAKAQGKHDREVPESEFRYPGPKPRTRETAILMLCDGVEGATRALPEPTPGRIENVVHSVLMDRLRDGQFDECDITLKDLYQVEDSLVKSLCRFYHGRVSYPKSEPKREAAS